VFWDIFTAGTQKQGIPGAMIYVEVGWIRAALSSQTLPLTCFHGKSLKCGISSRSSTMWPSASRCRAAILGSPWLPSAYQPAANLCKAGSRDSRKG
jgi:hypothetical protein